MPTPAAGNGDDYLFEQNTLMLGEARGFADVFKRGCFAWENKAPGRDLDKALKQLLGYSHALSNPPLLVVCDRPTIRIHTQFTGHPSEMHTVSWRPGQTRQANPAAPRLARPGVVSPQRHHPRHHRSRRQKLCHAGRPAAQPRLVIDKKGSIVSGTPSIRRSGRSLSDPVPVLLLCR